MLLSATVLLFKDLLYATCFDFNKNIIFKVSVKVETRCVIYFKTSGNLSPKPKVIIWGYVSKRPKIYRNNYQSKFPLPEREHRRGWFIVMYGVTIQNKTCAQIFAFCNLLR